MSAGRAAPFPPRSGEHCGCAMMDVASRDARIAVSFTVTISVTGRTAARPRRRTWPCCARSTTGSCTRVASVCAVIRNPARSSGSTPGAAISRTFHRPGSRPTRRRACLLSASEGSPCPSTRTGTRVPGMGIRSTTNPSSTPSFVWILCSRRREAAGRLASGPRGQWWIGLEGLRSAEWRSGEPPASQRRPGDRPMGTGCARCGGRSSSCAAASRGPTKRCLAGPRRRGATAGAADRPYGGSARSSRARKNARAEMITWATTWTTWAGLKSGPPGVVVLVVVPPPGDALGPGVGKLRTKGTLETIS